MELILWRHAEAEDGSPDLERELTGKGRKQAARMADWLNPRLPPDIRILSSPASRTLQTAQALGRDYEVVPELAPGASAEEVLAQITTATAAKASSARIPAMPTTARFHRLRKTQALEVST